jgi:hypothetical protein
MQEYLCADNISRRPIKGDLGEWVLRFPGIVAVAVALSSEPTQWLRACLNVSRVGDQTSSFISRIGLERPRFSPDLALGEIIVGLMKDAGPADAQHWDGLSKIEAVRASMSLLDERFEISRFDRRVILVRRRESTGVAGRSRPAYANVSQAVFDLFM